MALITVFLQFSRKLASLTTSAYQCREQEEDVLVIGDLNLNMPVRCLWEAEEMREV